MGLPLNQGTLSQNTGSCIAFEIQVIIFHKELHSHVWRYLLTPLGLGSQCHALFQGVADLRKDNALIVLHNPALNDVITFFPRLSGSYCKTLSGILVE